MNVISGSPIQQNANEHIVYFYSSTNRKYRTLLLNLKYGFDNGYSGLYIANEKDVDKIRAVARDFIKADDLKKLKIVTSSQWYMPDGRFRPNRIMEQFQSLIDDSLDKGFEGAYVSSDLDNIFDSLSNLQPLLSYETFLGKRFAYPLEAICAYPENQKKLHWDTILCLVQAHEKIITPQTETVIESEELCRAVASEAITSLFGKMLASSLEYSEYASLNNLNDFIRSWEIVFDIAPDLMRLFIMKEMTSKLEMDNIFTALKLGF